MSYKAKWIGPDGHHVPGIPARDLTPIEVNRAGLEKIKLYPQLYKLIKQRTKKQQPPAVEPEKAETEGA